MKLSAYKALLEECPRTAMIFDLTERFPRGPLAKLRPKHYEVTEREDWRGRIDRTVHDDAFVGGENGYDLFEIYELAKKGWWTSDLRALTTQVEGAGMGRQHMVCDENGDYQYNGVRQIFKDGPQLTRRLRTLEERLRRVRKIVEAKSKANLYGMSVGRMEKPVYLFADSEETARMQFDLMLKAAFVSGAERKAFHTGYRFTERGELNVDSRFHGPSHGPHEIMELNQACSAKLREINEARKTQIEELKIAIEAGEELAQMIDMFTINTCAQTFEGKA